MVGFFETGGVLISEKFLIFEKDIWRVLGKGVAVIYKTSHEMLFFKICSFCLTPKRCSSSTTNSPHKERALGEDKTLWVEIKTLPLSSQDKKLETEQKTGQEKGLNLL